MYRYKILGSVNMNSPSRPRRQVIICYVTAKDRTQAIDRAFDDMGLMAVTSVRKIGSKLK